MTNNINQDIQEIRKNIATIGYLQHQLAENIKDITDEYLENK